MRQLRRITNRKGNLEQMEIMQAEIQTNKNRMLNKRSIQRTKNLMELKNMIAKN